MKRFLTGWMAAVACAMTFAATAQVSFAATADLSITNDDGKSAVTPGGSVSYTITAANLGPDDAPGSTVADMFPASLTCSSWTCVGSGAGTCTASGSGNINDAADLPAGGSVTYSATCTVSSAVLGSLTNTATVTAPGGVTDSTPANNSATDTDTLSPKADLSITNIDGVAAATPGGSVTYTITAANAGPSDAPNTTIGDTFPAVLTCGWSCVGTGGGTCKASGFGNINDAVNLPSGGSVTYTAICNVSAAATGSLSNTAMVIAAGGITDPTPANNSATDTDTLPAATVPANLGVTITDGVTTAVPGSPVVYTITASNAGPSDAPGSTVTDTFPASLTACTWTCTSGNGTCTASGSGNINDVVNLPNGGSVTYTATCNITPATTGSLANTATVTPPGTVNDPTPANNSATDTDTLTPKVNLCITNTDNAPLNPTKTQVAGKTVTYTIKAFNTSGCSTATPTSGPSSAPAAIVTDTFPAPLTACTWTCSGSGSGSCTASGSGNLSDTPNLPFGGSVTYRATCTIPAGTTVGGLLNNTATVAAGTGVAETASADNSAIDTFTVGLQPDLTATITDGVTTVKPGDDVTYTATVTNNGPTIALGSSVVDTFPPGLTACTWTCSGANSGICSASGSGNINDTVNLVVGASVTYVAQCKVSAAAKGTLSNIITATPPAGMTLPPISSPHNSATDADVVNVSSDIALTMTDNRDSVQVGDVVDYVIDVTNPSGPSSPAIAEVIDVLPAELGSGSWTCTPSGNATCNSGSGGTLVDIATIPVGGKVEYVYSAVLVSAPAGDVLSNTASASLTSGSDPATGDNSATDNDNDVVAIFGDTFDSNESVTAKLNGAGTDQVSAQLQVDSGLLQHLGAVPVDIAIGRSADGQRLFTLQIARFGGNVVLRTLTPDAHGMNEISEWQTVDLDRHVLEFTWQPASASSSDGYFAVAAGGTPVLVDERATPDQLSSLQITVVNDVPWLILIGQ